LTNDNNNIKDEDSLQYLMKLNPDKNIIVWINENHDIFGNARSIDEIWGIVFENNKLTYFESENGSNGLDLPYVFGELKHLKKLYLSYTIIRNDIPKWICNLQKLEFIYLADNLLSGPIPTEFGKLKRLEELYCSKNNLSGSIPTEFSKLENITRLMFNDNELTGNVPTELLDIMNNEHNVIIKLDNNKFEKGFLEKKR